MLGILSVMVARSMGPARRRAEEDTEQISEEQIMNRRLFVLLTAAWCAVFALTTGSAFAQQINGTPGSPDATVTIDGKQLPPPDMKFGGVIKETAKESTPWWPP